MVIISVRSRRLYYGRVLRFRRSIGRNGSPYAIDRQAIKEVETVSAGFEHPVLHIITFIGTLVVRSDVCFALGVDTGARSGGTGPVI